VENNILGLQAGFRMHQKVGHWRLSNETRFLAAQNWVMEPIGDSAEFVPVGDIRFEAAYELTREFALRAGFQMIYFGQGVTRGDQSTNPNFIAGREQEIVMAGLTFGFTMNR
jgi:hypothetical protein